MVTDIPAFLFQEDYEKMEQLKREGKDPTSVLKNYMSLDDGVKIESWSKQESKPMKVRIFTLK